MPCTLPLKFESKFDEKTTQKSPIQEHNSITNNEQIHMEQNDDRIMETNSELTVLNDETTCIKLEPADLSRKSIPQQAENVTCIPEIEFINDNDDDDDAGTDNMSVYSNSSDPERLEVDMSQMQTIEENSNNSTTKSPTGDGNTNNESTNNVDDNSSPSALWQVLAENGFTNPNIPLTGEASQLLRKLISCRKLGMSITPAPPHYSIFPSNVVTTTPSSLHHHHNQANHDNNVTMKKTKPQQQLQQNQQQQQETKSSARRKQSYPTKATTVVDMKHHDVMMNEPKDDTETDYMPDFTGGSPWCNLGIVKGKVRC